MLKVEFWQERYASGEIPWDLNAPSPHFMELLKAAPELLKPGKMAVPGSGKGHDAALFGQAGFDVTGFDYALGAVQEATTHYGQWARFEQQNIFELVNQPDCRAQFDYILEHTCFCAISPKDRPQYVQMARHLLKPGGLLIGVFSEQGRLEGPPYDTSPSDIQEAFKDGFEILSITPKKPARDRSGTEYLGLLRRSQ